ncbi:MAG: c-type cytochrome [Verrucomicrobia bacterium]|nr:c-type cytochrome [Verrucomicrobiota bacterium]
MGKKTYNGYGALAKRAIAAGLIWSLVIFDLAANNAAASGQLSVEIKMKDGAERTLQLETHELLALDSVALTQVYVPYVDRMVEAQVLPLSAFIDFLELPNDVSLLANSYDGYFSVYRPEFIDSFEPYFVLAFTERSDGQLQLGDSPDLGPHYITFERQPEKGSDVLFDPDNKRPFGVNHIQIGAYEDLMGPLYSGALDDVTDVVASGREFYINNCMSCHAWEDKELGGVLSNRNSTILAVHARYNADYFKDYVYEPTRFIPDVLMPAHPHYTDAEIDAIAAFLMKSTEDDS